MIDRARLRCVALSPGDGSESSVVDSIAAALSRGATSIWLRERERDPRSRERLALAARELTRRADAALWIAGDVELAIAIGADAVHLGFRDPRPEIIRARDVAPAIGFSAHDPLDLPAIAAADYVTLSPFAPVEKDHGARQPLRASTFSLLRSRIACPVVALGGIDESNAAAAIRAGADGVAVRRAADRLERILVAIARCE